MYYGKLSDNYRKRWILREIYVKMVIGFIIEPKILIKFAPYKKYDEII